MITEILNLDSATSQVLALKPGQTFSRSRLIRRQELDDGVIAQTRKKIMSYLSPVVARAKQKDARTYGIHTAVAVTKDYDILVTGVIVLEGDDDEDYFDDEI